MLRKWPPKKAGLWSTSLPHKYQKEENARKILLENPVEQGLICILSVVEGCQTLQPVKNSSGLLELRSVTRKCKYYYFYYLDKEFGFMHVKLQTWFPFLIQVYINGREMMKHVFDKNGSPTVCMIILFRNQRHSKSTGTGRSI